ncbi:hypothetical protein CANCADRAFT_15943, partial [Tortispora caseinolytica NRRL Y-17796]
RELRRQVLKMFIDDWRAKVGIDLFPLLRLVIPSRDKERSMYHIKEKTLAKLMEKTLNLPPNSNDAKDLRAWKQPNHHNYSSGDLAQRVYDIARKRPSRQDPSEYTIDEINTLLDKLSTYTKSADQVEWLRNIYRTVNLEEFKWILRLILRDLHIGVSERTLLSVFGGQQAIKLYNATSNLKRVCWELADPTSTGSSSALHLFSCFRPHLAAFPKKSIETAVQKMGGADFYIEEKFDGERIQMHYGDNGAQIRFFSRNAKDYTHLYGSSIQDQSGSITRYLKSAFSPKVRNCILDGEMVAWDSSFQVILPFGTLKAAARSAANNKDGPHPMYVIFDILYLNDNVLLEYPLSKRKEALNKIINPILTRFQCISYKTAHTVQEVESSLRKVIANSSEGLVLKNPRSKYALNLRNIAWIKVKPDYMDELIEKLDCTVIGAFYGSGKRGNILASYLCGIRNDSDPDKIYMTFCRVGGGFSADDYRKIDQMTRGKWRPWSDTERLRYIQTSNKSSVNDKPDVWIKPEDSFVIEIKSGEIIESEYAAGYSLRFPRVARIRDDKNPSDGLNMTEFNEIRLSSQEEKKELSLSKKPELKRKRVRSRIEIYSGASKQRRVEQRGTLFSNCTFVILTGSTQNPRLTKGEIEDAVRSNGGSVIQSFDSSRNPYVIADRVSIAVSSLQKENLSIIRPRWISLCIESGYILPLEPSDLLVATDDTMNQARNRVDKYGDSYTRHISTSDLMKIVPYL